jgi:hypothetical protein
MMTARWLPGNLTKFVAVMTLAGALSAFAPGRASAATCASWAGGQPPSPGLTTALNGVAVLSPCRAWAVGYENNGIGFQTLAVRWNGFSWRVVPSPNPAGLSGINILNGVAATSRRQAWAVGYINGIDRQTLIERWGGASWKVSHSPDPGGLGHDNVLTGVTAVSARSAWAVGYYSTGSATRTLIEHWNGAAWRQVRSPNPSGDSNLSGVSATSPGNAWAVGSFTRGGDERTLIEHWNGVRWKVVPSPNPAPSAFLTGVTARSGNIAWAVGAFIRGSFERTLTERWNGTRWTTVRSPNANTNSNSLAGVTATSSHNAWAVGFYFTASTARTLIEHWNGTAWSRVGSPNLSSESNELSAVAASSATSIWAAGFYDNNGTDQNLALHCC